MDSPAKSDPLGDPGSKYANSPLTDKFDGTSVSIFGNLLARRVKKGTSVEKLPLIPKIELFIGSVPKFAF